MKNINPIFHFFLFCSFLLFIGTLTSCKSGSVPLTTKTEIKTETVEKTVLRDTTFEVAKDSSSYRASLEVINGIIGIKQIESQTFGKNLNKPKVSIKDNVVQVDCYTEALRLFAQLKDYYKTTHQEQVITLPPVIIEAQLSLWQNIQIWFGRVFIGLLFALIIYIILKLFKLF